jgi:hypothetical protein
MVAAARWWLRVLPYRHLCSPHHYIPVRSSFITLFSPEGLTRAGSMLACLLCHSLGENFDV